MSSEQYLAKTVMLYSMRTTYIFAIEQYYEECKLPAWLSEKVATKYESSNPNHLSATLLLALPGACKVKKDNLQTASKIENNTSTTSVFLIKAKRV